MAATILQGAGDVAVLLNPGPESFPKECPHCSKVIHANGALFESYMTRCLCSRPDQINLSDISFSADSDNCCKIQGNFKSVFNCNGMKFAHQNIRSLLSKIDELPILFADLNNNIHFLTLSETWHDSDVLDSELSIDGYRLFRTDDRNKNGGGFFLFFLISNRLYN
jgi:hypothetical protein